MTRRTLLFGTCALAVPTQTHASVWSDRVAKAMPWCEFRFGGMHPANAAAISAKLLRVQRRFPRIASALGLVGAEADGPGWPENAIAATWTLPGANAHPLAVTFKTSRWRDNDAGFAGETMLHELGHVAAWVIDLDADARAKRARWVARKSEEQWAEGAKNVLNSGRGNGPVAALIREHCK